MTKPQAQEKLKNSIDVTSALKQRDKHTEHALVPWKIHGE